MKAKDIRDMSPAEIAQRIADEERDMQNLRFQHKVARLDDPLVLRRKRRDIARLKTIHAQLTADEAQS